MPTSIPDEYLVTEEIVDEVIARHPDPTGDVLGVLEQLQLQHPHRYLPLPTLRLVARKMGLAPSQILGVVTFYSFFNLAPQGRHSLMVCRGTACHTRGSKKLLDAVRQAAGAPPSEDLENTVFTTPDRALTVRTVACFGQCALAPVVAFDNDIHGYMNDIRLHQLLHHLDADAGAASARSSP